MPSNKQSRSTLRLSASSVLGQANKLAPLLAWLYVPVLFLLIGFAIAAARHGIHPSSFMREPQVVAHLPFYTGMVSTLGCFLWAIAAGICFFGWAMLRSIARHDPEARRFALLLFCCGVFTSHLLLDDMFTFHEQLYPRYFGVREEFTYIAYMLATLAGLIAFRKTILRTDYVLLLLAFAFLSMHNVFDVSNNHPERVLGRWAPYLTPDIIFGQWRILVEDGFKFLGIVSWLAYFWKTTFKEIRAAATRPVLVSTAAEPAIADVSPPLRAAASRR